MGRAARASDGSGTATQPASGPAGGILPPVVLRNGDQANQKGYQYGGILILWLRRGGKERRYLRVRTVPVSLGPGMGYRESSSFVCDAESVDC